MMLKVRGQPNQCGTKPPHYRNHFAALFLGLWSSFVVPALAATESGAAEAILSVLNMQTDAWNKGDLDRFMSGYLDSDATSYTSAGVEIRGYRTLKNRYIQRYGNNKQTMGNLSFADLRVVELGRTHALCTGGWRLQREGLSDLCGAFSLVFAKTDEGWKIFHDHSSVRPDGQ